MSDFFGMGGYAGYVWPAYIMSAVTLSGLVIYVLRRAGRTRRRLKDLEKRDRPPGG